MIGFFFLLHIDHPSVNMTMFLIGQLHPYPPEEDAPQVKITITFTEVATRSMINLNGEICKDYVNINHQKTEPPL